MGRPRTFDLDEVIGAARDRFVRTGYLGTSVDDLLTATGIGRASLYQAFGSKRGLFLATLRRQGAPQDLDLVLVAVMDLCADDAEMRSIISRMLDGIGDAPTLLGEHALRRAGLKRE